MKDLLYMKNLHEPIEGEEVRPVDLDDKKLTQLNQKIVSTIILWIDQSVYHHIVKESRVNVHWRKLETIYEQPTTHNKANLMKRLVNLKCKERCSISEFQSLVN